MRIDARRIPRAVTTAALPCAIVLSLWTARAAGFLLTPSPPSFPSRSLPSSSAIRATDGDPPVDFPNTAKIATRARIESEDSTMKNSRMVSTRRSALLRIVSVSVASVASARIASADSEIEKKSGELFTPKSQMLGGGGSAAARGIPLAEQPRRQSIKQNGKKNDGLIQNLYDIRFIAYLSRFLLSFDPSAGAWWDEETEKLSKADAEATRLLFAGFAESVEVGLADYFIGPYGSYASVQAAIAGLNAAAPATSSSSNNAVPKPAKWDLWGQFFGGGKPTAPVKKTPPMSNKKQRQGVYNLLCLLQARYTRTEEKIQLSLLFSMLPLELQPTLQITGLMGEVDNTSIQSISLSPDQSLNTLGGHSIKSIPKVTIEPPPALGTQYKIAKAKAIMCPTSRILKITVTDGGEGYLGPSPPSVQVTLVDKKKKVEKQCEAAAILNREGNVEEIVVLDPGMGYTDPEFDTTSDGNSLIVTIGPPPKRKNETSGIKPREATAVAELEYRIDRLDLIQGGNGYAHDQPPQITIAPPQEDPDWFVMEERIPLNERFATATVTEMSGLFDTRSDVVTDSMLMQIQEYPMALFPNTIRPEKYGSQCYTVPGLPSRETLQENKLPSPFYRAFDPIFGGVGTVPVTKRALSLSADEYTRLALSGAICTVIVRTALNPLELIKTKIQLGNDSELTDYTTAKADDSTIIAATNEGQTQQDEDKEAPTVGTFALMKSLVELRGSAALFQSADITFLASLVFGSFGFGATELFRRSFTLVFFEDGGGSSDLTAELILLVAAAVACILTSFLGAPFELLRVRSMGNLQSKNVKGVFQDFLRENRSQRSKTTTTAKQQQPASTSNLTFQDVYSFWGSFAPTVSRELPFAVVKFLAFDTISQTVISAINSSSGQQPPLQVGAGTIGLAVSALSGAFAGVAGAVVSHPADLILTLTSASKSDDDVQADGEGDEATGDWKDMVKDMLSKEGGVGNLFLGLPARSVFFFLVIGLQFFLYDYVKNILQVGADDLTLVLDVFYAVRRGLVDMQ